EEGPGFLMLDTAPAQTVDCMANNASVAARRAEDPETDPGAECTIERNLDFTGAVEPYVRRAALTCDVDGARWMGQTPDGDRRYEIGCAGQPGYWIDVNTGGDVT